MEEIKVSVNMFDALRTALVPQGTASIVRLQMQGAATFDALFIQQAIGELEKACTWQAMGMGDLTKLEQLALHLLCDSAGLTCRKKAE